MNLLSVGFKASLIRFHHLPQGVGITDPSAPVRCAVYGGGLAQKDVLAEIYTDDASIRVYKHQLLPNR